jgi:hypothetical protein
VYRDKHCEDIVGGAVKEVIKLTDDRLFNLCVERGTKIDNLWLSEESERTLEVIAVPYKNGSHVPSKLTDFTPIIKQLQALHGKGYVHGDIRAFNVAFDGSDGGLIDFDNSGTPGTPYPSGYRSVLKDGRRVGSGRSWDRYTELDFWHDWYALGQLMFNIHRVVIPIDASMETKTWLYGLETYWRCISKTPSDEKIREFILQLESLEKAGYCVEPNRVFKGEIESSTQSSTKS